MREKVITGKVRINEMHQKGGGCTITSVIF